MTPRVMIVEDEEPLSLMLRYNLEAEGYQVDTVERGDDAETRLRENVPDLLLLDWMLPGVSGIEIINTKEGCWQTSNTRELIRVIQERNKDSNGNFIHQARIGKLFARVNAEGLVPGLHVETVVHDGDDHNMVPPAGIARGVRFAFRR